MKRGTLLLSLLFILNQISAQGGVPRPKLVVGLVVDQMRWDYLYRYQERYATGGFRRILKEGFSCENAFIPYTPTYTAPGHTCVYTGSVPSLHGIVGNSWYQKANGRFMYCTDDSTVQSVGTTSNAGKMSPRNMWASTVTDELRLATNFRSKTIGIALKDRGAILPAGHTANAAYWYDNASAGFISSTYYMQDLPQWVKNFNARKLPDQYMSQPWKTLYPIASYVQSTADAQPFESNLPGEDNTFDHRTDTLKNSSKYEAFRYTPYGNTYTFEMAKAAIEGEALGSRGTTDFLAVSFSSPDYIGHAFGPNSIEVEDCYLRFDRDLAAFLQYLDGKLGKGSYLLFMTADHGAAHVPAFANEHGIPGGVADDALFRKGLNDALQQQFGMANIVLNVSNYQVFLADGAMAAQNVNKDAVKAAVIKWLLQQPSVSKAFDLHNMANEMLPQKVKERVVNGYNQKLSGDIQFLFQPQYFDGGSKGTTHGSWNPYDAHIPLLWFGWGIKPGKLNKEVYMTDIAPTLAALLHIQMPNAAVGDVIDLTPGPFPTKLERGD